MIEPCAEKVHTEHAVLDIGGEVGALIIYCRPELRGKQINLSPRQSAWQTIHTNVLERRVNGSPVFAALFLALTADTYVILGRNASPIGEVTIVGGQVTEMNWRHLLPSVWLTDNESSSSCALSPDILPPRYRERQDVSAAPMGTAPMRYNEQGEVAWDQMWTDFCDLALAGGPSHRDTLLEPAAPEEVRAAPQDYARVLTELERGLRLVSGLPIAPAARPGWIGLQCGSEKMAIWLLRAILVENVCARREGSTLFLPAGPAFTLEKEIKNVITVVAKTYHYWNEHSAGIA
jgi:hypothetical protein